MTAWTGNILRALADKKGTAALEYGTLAAVFVTVAIAGYRPIFNSAGGLVAKVYDAVILVLP